MGNIPTKPKKLRAEKSISVISEFDESDNLEDSEELEIICDLGSVFCNKYKCDEAPVGIDNLEQESGYLASIYEEFS